MDFLNSINEENFPNLKVLYISYFDKFNELSIVSGFKNIESISISSPSVLRISAETILKIVKNKKPGFKISA